MSEKKKILTEEELNKVNGGMGSDFNLPEYNPSMFDIDTSVPDWCTPVAVEDVGNGSAVCPYDGSVLANENHSPIFAHWLFRCKKCGKWFSKTWEGQWYVSDREP